ncbi:hypothetical protein HN011_005425 [Eciton burchellii]|nr:hypothetical protein HN011_005425 [Eciton burchellii]
MAQSRLEKVGTVYTRIISLIKGKALKEEDKPLWISIYETFPPKYEPRFDRQLPRKPVKPIFYKEDRIRARFHKEQRFIPATDLRKENVQSMTQKFLSIYKTIKKEETNANAYKQALQQYNSQLEARMESRKIEN